MSKLKIEIKKVLTVLGKDIVTQAKKNIKSSDISSKGHLYNGMKYKSTVGQASVGLVITIADYWEYMDYGVEGVGGQRADGSNWVKRRVTNNKFKYKEKMPPPSAFSRYTSERSGQFAIAKSVFHRGLKTTSFFNDPFDAEIKELEAKILQASYDAVEKSLTESISNNDNITII
tara:strand:+ start:242 stop:763 length:522 start_codon:yes stop_codon:yes gene_type:complete